jgi:hypothetical protein
MQIDRLDKSLSDENKYMKKKRILFSFWLLLAVLSVSAQNNVETQRQYLSGHGCDDMVNWQFYCTGGRNSGKWTTIGVPSCWELQGFGTYQYGMRFYGKANPPGIADEKGLYKYEFYLPSQWKGRQIQLAFEAVMTDVKVTINGRKGGHHQGGFYRFILDVSDRVYFGKHKNLLEVEVSKESANPDVNLAERRGDYWNFGGIIRPVFIIAKPVLNIDRVAVDAGMDGHFKADCFLDRAVQGAKIKTEIFDGTGRIGKFQGARVGTSMTDCRSSDEAHVDLMIAHPKLWTAETPNLYTAVFTLEDASGIVLHREYQKFGFRTIEYRTSDGVYVNGKKVIFKGVNRHSLRPESGRTLSKAKCIKDVNLIKSMNMNAVRLSHYPADPEFYDACDSLGLYVMDELTGWHHAYDTATGQELVKEMVTRDVNHPSIIFWSNGNEGGFNYELQPDFGKWDIQKRVVIYPWANKNGFETMHYRSWGETQMYMRKPEIFMPTEFLHGLYDGGHGAGLADYWKMMMSNPRCAGGFLWDLCDQGIKRTDENGIIDCCGNYGADGIVGPHFEKEGSYYTIKQVWCPIQVDVMRTSVSQNNVQLKIQNHYSFLNLNTCKLTYRYLKMPKCGDDRVKVTESGILAKHLSIAPGNIGYVDVPVSNQADVLEVKAVDPYGRELFTWDFPKNVASEDTASSSVFVNSTISQDTSFLSVNSCGRTYVFSKKNGRLTKVLINQRVIHLSNGPRFIAARRSDRSYDQYYNHDDKEVEQKNTQYSEYPDQGVFSGFSVKDEKGVKVLTAHYKLGTLQQVDWRFLPDSSVKMDYQYDFGGVVDEMGITFDYPEILVKSKSWVGLGPYRIWQNRTQGPQFNYWHNAYNDPIPGESWDYPEFKGYFGQVRWMQLQTKEGRITMSPSKISTVGVYTPRDGRDHILYTLPQTDIAFLRVIPAVRNKVNSTDLNGPSARPYWAENETFSGSVIFKFE